MLSSEAGKWLSSPGSRTLFYPAAGFDWKLPLALSHLCRQGGNFPMFNRAVYVDYSSHLDRILARALAAGDRLQWGPDITVDNIKAVKPSVRTLWNLRRLSHHNPQGGSATSDSWYLFDLQLPSFSLPILYVPADALAFLAEVVIPWRIKPTYVATVTDGCRKGGNWCCLSRKDGTFYTKLAETHLMPEYWITDHGDIDFPVLAELNTGVYGNGISTLSTVN